MKIIKKAAYVIMFTVLVFSAVLIGCTNTKETPVTKQELVLGTVCNITIYDKPEDKIFTECFDRLKQIEDEMSINKDGTQVDNVNDAAGVKAVKVTDDIYGVIKTGIGYGGISGGKFDISIGPIVKLWNIGTDKERIPGADEIKAKLPLVNYKNIILNDTTKEVMLKDKGMIIDLGGIAKGYAADEVSKVLKKDGIKRAMIDLGGNVLPVGKKTDGTQWNIGVQDPNDSRGNMIGTVKVYEQTVVTSGIYERYFEKDGKRYHHILDTKTGYSVDNELASVSIITNKSIDGDGLSTSVFALGVSEGIKLSEKLGNFEAIFVTKNKEVYITKGLKDKFTLTNANYTLKN